MTNTRFQILGIPVELSQLEFITLEPVFIVAIITAYIWAARKQLLKKKPDAARADMFLGLSYLAYALFKVGYLILYTGA